MRYWIFRRTRLSQRIRVVHAPSQAAACAVAQQKIFNDKLATRETELLVLPMDASTQAGSGFLAMANSLGVFT
jgi:hypothetical protein